MQLAVLATDEQWNELAINTAGVEWVRATTPFAFTAYNAAAFFILIENAVTDFSATEKPVFINSVTAALQQLGTPQNVLRINGWHSFLQRAVWEVSGEISIAAATILQQINNRKRYFALTQIITNILSNFINLPRIIKSIIN